MPTGKLSAKYEGKGNPHIVSSGKGDKGGVSYGAYQLSTNSGNAQLFVIEYYPNEFKGLKAGSKEFSDKWKSVTDDNFLSNQHAYIKKQHYEPFVAKMGVPMGKYSQVIKEVIWSISVQHGDKQNILKNKLATIINSNESDRQKVMAIYEERANYIRSNNVLGAESIIRGRYLQEMTEALGMIV